MRKIKWSVQLPKLEKLHEDLRARVNDLIDLREQRTKLEELRALPQSSPVKMLCVGFPLSATRDLRASSKRLYDAVSAVNDSDSHCIDLQLPCDTTQEQGDSAITIPITPEREFRLRIAPLSNIASFTPLIVRVRPEEEALPIVPPASPKAILHASTTQALLRGMKRKPNFQSCTTAQQSRHALCDLPILGFKKSRPEVDKNTEPAAEKQQSSQDQQILFGMVVSLGSILDSKAHPVLTSDMTYVGQLPSVDSYRHVLFKTECQRALIRTSLSEIIQSANSSSAKKSFSWPIQRRCELAYMLALSLLCYSGGWFQANWRCEDISFFVAQRPQQIIDETIKSPHISATSGPSRIQTGMPLIPSEPLISLAIALIEIGYGNSLHNLYSEVETMADGGLRMQWDYFKEAYGAKKLSNMIQFEMGVRQLRRP